MKPIRLSALLVSLLTLLAAPTAWSQSESATAFTDAGTAQAIENELLFNFITPAHEIVVSVSDGVATLRGTVDNLLASEYAGRLAASVMGVKAVANEIRIEPLERTDEAIADDIRSALRLNPATEAFEINLTVNDGEVTVSGTVDSYAEAELAAQLAKSVRGVRELTNLIETSPSIYRPDAEIAEEVRELIEWDPLVDDDNLEVEVAAKVVTVSGTVRSMAEKNRVRAHAWVRGAVEVDVDGLAVDPGLAAPTTPPLTVTDAALQRHLEAVLRDQPNIPSDDITVAVVDGQVTLRGYVDRLATARRAEEEARQAVGVQRVFNRLQVLESAFSDDILGLRLEEALARDPFLSPRSIEVEVANDHATLSGSVDTPFEKARATELAAEVRGIQSISDHLTVDRWSHPWVYHPYAGPFVFYSFDRIQSRALQPTTDRNIAEDIRSELWWSPFVDSDTITVTVDDGVATLTGVVDSLAEMDAAVENAYEGGALRVDNELVLSASPEVESEAG